jgi:hypothetical protein
MRGDRLEVNVSFDPAKGYVAMMPDLAEPITALSLAVLRRRIKERLLPDTVDVRLILDRRARLERTSGGKVVWAGPATLPGRAKLRSVGARGVPRFPLPGALGMR